MICPTCKINCSFICPSCYEAVGSTWHISKEAKRFKATLKKFEINKNNEIQKNIKRNKEEY